MASRVFDNVQTLGRNVRKISGSFVPNGSSAIDNSQNTGKGFTAEYSGTGLYRINFTDKYGPVRYVAASLRQSPRTQDVEVRDIDPALGYMEIHGFARGGTTPADITAAAGTVIYFTAEFDDGVNI